MPVSTTHPDYDAHASQWQRCRDAIDGSDAVKGRGNEYLPKLSDQDTAEYDAYRLRALWYGASARTIQGLMGAVMRKDPAVEVPTILEDHLDDVTLTGISFNAFAKTCLQEVLTIGRYGVLVDMPDVAHETQRPYYAAYLGESIVNWTYEGVNGVPKLVRVVLREQLWEEDEDDDYKLNSVEQYRVLRLKEIGEEEAESGAQYGSYEVETFREDPNKKDVWISQGIVTPMLKGQPFDFIPFCFFGPTSITPAIEKPPILDLVDVNLSHYRSSADLEHGRHFCGLPTPWVAGFPEQTVMRIGASTAWTSSDPQAKVGMLEFTGQGLGALEKALDSKEKLMSVLGARLLEEAKRTVEAADTLTMRLSGEQSVLRSVANSVSTGLSKLLEWTVRWSGVSPEEAVTATATLNTDFMDAQMSFVELQALVASWQAGAISYDTMYYLMEKGEVTRPGIEAEEEKALIEIQQPAPMLPTQPGGKGAAGGQIGQRNRNMTDNPNPNGQTGLPVA